MDLSVEAALLLEPHPNPRVRCARLVSYVTARDRIRAGREFWDGLKPALAEALRPVLERWPTSSAA